MGLPAYIPVNLAATAVSVTFATLLNATVYPASYVNDQILGTVAKASGLGANITFDVTNSPWKAYDSVFVGNHNLSAVGTVNIYAGTVLLSLGVLAGATYRAKNLWVPIANQTVNNYLQVQVADTTMNNLIEVGEIVIGARVALPRNFQWSPAKQKIKTGISLKTLAGHPWDYELSKYRKFAPTFLFPESEYSTFEAWGDAVERNPFVWIPDVATSEAYYVKLARGFEPQAIGPRRDAGTLQEHYQWTATMEALPEGITVGA